MLVQGTGNSMSHLKISGLPPCDQSWDLQPESHACFCFYTMTNLYSNHFQLFRVYFQFQPWQALNPLWLLLTANHSSNHDRLATNQQQLKTKSPSLPRGNCNQPRVIDPNWEDCYCSVWQTFLAVTHQFWVVQWSHSHAPMVLGSIPGLRGQGF